LIKCSQLSHQLETQSIQTTQISDDLANLQKIHENLASEYEQLRSERESCRNELKACQRELRLATEQINTLKLANQDQELLRMEAKTLTNLRAEHSKLKVSLQ
jgi:predicted  nucleic acid-binding Zn-ribbon protein